MTSIPFASEAYSGEVHGAWPDAGAIAARLAAAGEWLAGAQPLSHGPQPLARHALHAGGVEHALAIKSFPAPQWFRARDLAMRGSRAQRSFRTAERLVDRGVGTPMPLAYLDRWQGGRLAGSHYVCAFQPGATTFRDELQRLYREDPLCRRILALMEAVAGEVRRMHDAGVWHLDLGNQNILVTRAGDDAWRDVRFIDLDRARLAQGELDLRQRARDLSRIALPSALLRYFLQMYFGRAHPPAEFVRWESHYRRRYAFHAATRRYRHPIRTLRAAARPAAAAPRVRDLWIWDDRSLQPVGTREKSDRYRDYPLDNGYHVARGVLRSALPVLRRYRELAAASFTREVALAGRIGLAVGTEHGVEEREARLLAALGTPPVLLRLYRHAPDAHNERLLEGARRLKRAGHAVHLALVQDRAGARDAAVWRAFVAAWLPRFSGVADQVEIGHAVNRIKWGVRHFHEYRAMVDAVVEVARSAGPFRLMGPAAIDFEYHYLAGLLDVLPREGVFDALSHHLYVDRRGAPENLQSGRFSAVEKFALARAFAAHSGAVRGERLVVSEVNWPIAGTGPWSPVASPYADLGALGKNSEVDEETHADYLVRYYALALCSGHVDSVYWWRFVARGFGLVDDARAEWRPRPAYAALRQFAGMLGAATFVERIAAGEGAWLLRFRLPGGGGAAMGWAHPRPVALQPPFAYAALLSRDGAEVGGGNAPVTLGARPVYFHDVR